MSMCESNDFEGIHEDVSYALMQQQREETVILILEE